MMPQTTNPCLFSILRNPDNTANSAALRTFRVVAYVNYLMPHPSFCCQYTFSFPFSSSMNSELVQMICIFYNFLPYLLLSYTILSTSSIFLEKIQLFGRASLQDKRKLSNHSNAPALIKQWVRSRDFFCNCDGYFANFIGCRLNLFLQVAEQK